MGVASRSSGSDAAAASRSVVQMRHGSGHASGDNDQGLSCEEMPQQQHASQQKQAPPQQQPTSGAETSGGSERDDVASLEPACKRAIRLAMHEEVEHGETSAAEEEDEDEEEDLLARVCRRKRMIRGKECEVTLHSSWLADQRTHDDMRFANDRFLQYNVPGCSQPLVVEQNFRLGKGGVGWDAAFILAEHLFQTPDTKREAGTRTTVVELGSGLGTAGLALAVSPEYGATDVFLTDLDTVLRICRRNVELNQLDLCGHNQTTDGSCYHLGPSIQTVEVTAAEAAEAPKAAGAAAGAVAARPPTSTVSVSELRWGRETAEHWAIEHLNQRQVDLIIGADVVVPSFYSSEDLLETLRVLAGESTTVVLVVKHRAGDELANAFDAFYGSLRRMFRSVVVATPTKSAIKHPERVYKLVTAKGLLAD
jgi:hypothetical protein